MGYGKKGGNGDGRDKMKEGRWGCKKDLGRWKEKSGDVKDYDLKEWNDDYRWEEKKFGWGKKRMDRKENEWI